MKKKPAKRPATRPLSSDGTKVGDKRTVLVVDDYDDAREMYAEYLEFAGFRVETARDGAEAVEKANSAQPDVILMDLSLPVMDGWEATRRLKSAEDTRDIPVVALTGHVLAGSSEVAKEAGADEFLAKPALPTDVEQRIRKMLKPNRVKVPGK